MNKSTLRLSVIGAILLLGSLAFALAQHDSRKRSHANGEFKSMPSQPAVPIAFDAAEEPQGLEAGPQAYTVNAGAIVRGNNDDLMASAEQAESLSAMPTEPDSLPNPLRQLENGQEYPVVSASATEQESGSGGLPPFPSTVPASDQAKPLSEATSNPLPSAPPAWMSESAGTGAQPVPTNSGTNLPPIGNAATSPGTVMPVPQVTYNASANNQGNSPQTITQPQTGLPTANNASFPNTTLPGTNNGTTSGFAPRQSETPPANTGRPTSQNTGPGLTNVQRPAPWPTSNPPTNNNQSIADRAAEPRSGASSPSVGGDNFAAPSRTFVQTSSSSQPVPVNLAGLVSNEPGNRYLDGSQNPVLQIQKRGFDEVRVGKRTTFTITVRNTGNFTAHDVTVVDSVPRGMRFADANPPVTPSADGILTWKLGEMKAGDERTISLEMIPEMEGELGSVASVHFAAQASVRTVATLPRLELNINPQTESTIGGEQEITVTLKNVGTGLAKDVELQADLPAQLLHQTGVDSLSCPCPDLAPGQSITIPLKCKAVNAGQAICLVRAMSEGEKQAEQQIPVTVLAPSLEATIEGPRKRFLDRQATYTFKVTNTGTAPATNLVFDVFLPAGLRFNASDNHDADYSPSEHTVKIGLRELQVGQTAPFRVTVLPVERGSQAIKMIVRGDLGINAEAHGQVDVEGLSELEFTIGQDNGTIEIGSNTVYTVQVTNMGNTPDRKVRLAIALPEGAEPIRVIDAPVQFSASGNQIIFEPIEEMRSRQQHNFRFEVRHNQVGAKIIRSEVTSQNWPEPTIKELGTRVYDDRN